MSLHVKICGVTDALELQALAEAGAHYAGLWFDVPAARRSLTRERFLELGSTPARGVRAVAVTTQSDPDAIAAFVARAPVAAVQAHGFLLPGGVRRLRALLGASVEIFKVLHVKGEECLERALLEKYVESGVDAFVIDTFVSRERIGSTGQSVPVAAVESIVGAVGAHRTLLAGGVDEAKIATLAARLALRGVDIDSASRVSGRIDHGRVRALVQAARGERGEAAHAR